MEKLWTRDASVLHLNRFTGDQIESYFIGLQLKYSMVFKNHWLTPIILDLAVLLRRPASIAKRKKLDNSDQIKFEGSVPLVSKIQYFLSIGEMRLLQKLPSEGVFILIEKESI